MTESAATWYYAKGNQQLGPITQDALRAMLASGEVAPTDLVWTTGMAQWEEARKVPGLVPEPPPPQSEPAPAPAPHYSAPPPPRFSYGTGRAQPTASSPPPPPPPLGYPPPIASSQHGKAVGAFVCGLLSVLCAPAGIGMILAIVAMAMGSGASREMARTGNFEGRGLAKAAFILGIVGLCLSATVCGGWGFHRHIHYYRF